MAKYMTEGFVKPENIKEFYRRVKNMTDAEGIEVISACMAADGGKFWVFHESSSHVVMAGFTKQLDDIVEFDTTPVVTKDELSAIS
jgi:hypothetical protein